MSEVTLKESIIKYLSEILSAHRYQHVLGVAKAAKQLSLLYGYDPDDAEIAALLHDVAKELPKSEMQRLAKESFGNELPDEILQNGGLLHGYAAVTVAKNKFAITDQAILLAIAHHTTGAPHMSLLEKIIFLADYIEDNRDYDGVNELRMLASKDLDKAVLKGYDSTITHLLEQDKFVFVGTIINRNFQLHYMQSKQ